MRLRSQTRNLESAWRFRRVCPAPSGEDERAGGKLYEKQPGGVVFSPPFNPHPDPLVDADCMYSLLFPCGVSFSVCFLSAPSLCLFSCFCIC